MAKPSPDLLADAERVLEYLYRTRSIGLRYTKSASRLAGYSDSDWAVKHSTSGWVFLYNSATISWGTKKQTSVALSSCEAEIMAASEATKEAVYLDTFLSELGLSDGKPIDLSVDNTGARDLAYNPEHHDKTKHIERRHFYVREMVEAMRIRVPFVSTTENLADFFTKALPSKSFHVMRDRIMNVPECERESVSGADVAAGGC